MARRCWRAGSRGGTHSEFLPLSRLSCEQEGLWIFALAADLEGAEVLVPEIVRSLGLGLSPNLQLIQVFRGDPSLAKAVEQVVPQRRGQTGPLDRRSLSGDPPDRGSASSPAPALRGLTRSARPEYGWRSYGSISQAT